MKNIGASILVSFSLLVALASPASASSMLCVGDSNLWFGTGDDTDWCAQAAAIKGGYTRVADGVPGDRTAQCLTRLAADLAAGDYDVVVLACGTNDVGLFGVDEDNDASLLNIMEMAKMAHDDGAFVFVLNIPPRNNSPYFAYEGFTERLTDKIARGVPALDGAAVIDIRAPLALLGWDAHTSDGVHFNNAGRAKVGAAVAAWLP